MIFQRSFNMYLLNIHYISGMVLGAEDQMMQQMGL